MEISTIHYTSKNNSCNCDDTAACLPQKGKNNEEIA